jgi:hypothetical protein
VTRALPEDVPQAPGLLSEDIPDPLGVGYRRPRAGPLYIYIGRTRSGTAHSGVTSEAPDSLASRCFRARWRELTVYRLPRREHPVAMIGLLPGTGKRAWWAESAPKGARRD